MNPPIRSLDSIYPAGSFMCARTTREVMRWNVPDIDALPAYRLDATPAQLVGFAGDMAFVAHKSAATPLAMDFAAHCGLPGCKQLHLYETSDEAADIAAKLMRAGGKLVHNFGTLPALEEPEGHLVHPELYDRLNSKVQLSALAGEQNVPAHTEISLNEAVDGAVGVLEPPVFIKLAAGHSTGGGAGVYFCKTPEEQRKTVSMLHEQLAPETRLLVEQPVDIIHSWCAGVHIDAEGAEWLSASQQQFSAPARQCANLVDVTVPASSVQELALKIARKAQEEGFHGFAGFDIGETADGDAIAFDLNFRPNSSTGLLLAANALLARTGLPVARTFFLRHDGPLPQLLDCVEKEAAAGRIIPGSMFDAQSYCATCDEPATRSCLDGWIAAESEDQARDWVKLVKTRLN